MPPTRPFVVAIDGPAASGKGTLARRLAERFGLAHLDTGKLYRATAFLVLDAGADPADPAAAVAAARRVDTALLADTSWWVRAAAKETLFLLGSSGLEAATEMLQDADGFARDGAREVVSAFRRETRPLELVG